MSLIVPSLEAVPPLQSNLTFERKTSVYKHSQIQFIHKRTKRLARRISEFCGPLNLHCADEVIRFGAFGLGVSGLSLHCACVSSAFRITRAVPASHEEKLMKFAMSNCTYDCSNMIVSNTLFHCHCDSVGPRCIVPLTFGLLPQWMCAAYACPSTGTIPSNTLSRTLSHLTSSRFRPCIIFEILHHHLTANTLWASRD
jgi:hypothetical protein